MPATTAPTLTIWMTDDIPVRMIYGQRRWRVSDTPTPLETRDGCVSSEPRGWRFQATDEEGFSLVFDVFNERDHWHVHRTYS
ncbi:hypothetical protein [Microbacterium hatanonis]|uniref:Uncharacterized protein n=1 Tax=Microbacterium hatanonis TaxID=404366 RepID=A0A5C8I096_9MICO|nr:hypothetical protein [Microbacterium hatanonis]TXK12327.1 hypothetical protein FVP77_02270 [Microbacterium hatanonis]